MTTIHRKPGAAQLCILRMLNGDRVSRHELAEDLTAARVITLNTAYRNIALAERQGLIEPVGPEDRWLQLTPGGRVALAIGDRTVFGNFIGDVRLESKWKHVVVVLGGDKLQGCEMISGVDGSTLKTGWLHEMRDTLRDGQYEIARKSHVRI